MTVLTHMRFLADAALSDAQWTTLTSAMPGWSCSMSTSPPLKAGGILHHGPDAFSVSAVNALATRLTGYTANGWYHWRRARDNRLLADLRTELVRR
ncbi:hypothetical protein [Actinophytocola sp. NPDC049390]|uniref:hypothetical protein n=1 Tax=Actinophytocola sp. NPDC049390 TaxID=3363894 RepID=UPI0037B940C6